MFCLFTCGVYPYCWQWVKNKIDFKNMAIKRQIMIGVMATLLIVLCFLMWTLIFNMQLFFTSTSNQLGQNLFEQFNANVIRIANDATDQCQSVLRFHQWTLQKNNGMIEQIIHPTYFDVYPIDWTVTQIYRFSQLTAQNPPVTTTTQTITYSASSTLTAELGDIAKKMTTFNKLWQRQVKTYMGP